MNIIEVIQKDIAKEKEAYEKRVAELNKMIDAANNLPPEILSLNDCSWFYGFVWNDKCETLTMAFESDISIKQLKLLGIQGFKTSFCGQYLNDPQKWMWSNGTFINNGVTYNFNGGHPAKPATCRIEEVDDEPAKNNTPKKKLQAVCELTGEVV